MSGEGQQLVAEARQRDRGSAARLRLSLRFELLRTPTFIAAVALLLLNDVVLKRVFANWITGKLSDFAGLWALAYFLIAVTACRRHFVALALGAAFIWWKSPASGSFIALWNSAAWPAIGRTVDASDLVALVVLLMLPSASRQCVATRPAQPRRIVNALIALFAMVAFVATQRTGENVCCSGEWHFNGSKSEVISRLKRAGATDMYRHRTLSAEQGEWYSFVLPERFCGSRVHANVRLSESEGTTAMKIIYILYTCAERADDSVQRQFDTLVADVAKPAA